MRLCYLADPTSNHTVKWLHYFIQHGHEVHLMGWNEPAPSTLDGAYYHHLPAELPQPFWGPARSVLWHLGLWDIAHRRQIKKLLESIQPNLFDILMLNAGQIPAALAWHGPLVITPWGSDLLVYPQRYEFMTRLLLRIALHRANLVLCNSAQLAQAARGLGARADRIRSVGQIVDLNKFKPGLDTSTLRDRIEITGSPVLLSPRLLLPNYRIDTVIRAFARVLHTFPQAQLLLLGDRNLDPDYAALLDVEVNQLNLQGHVIFGGRFPNDSMPTLFVLADVVLSIPVSDSRPASIFEAMACGVPVVASDLTSIREFVQEGETGLLAPVGDAQATAKTVVRVLSDASLRTRITSQALEFVRREGDYETQMAKVAGYYNELLGH